MTAGSVALACTIILMMPMLYFLLASPTFLLARLDDPTVTWLLRGLFSVQLALVAAFGAVAATAFAMAGGRGIVVGLGVVAAVAVGARRWFLHGLDAGIRARDAGDTAAVPRLRRLHWAGMLYNATQFGAVVASIPRLFEGAT